MAYGGYRALKPKGGFAPAAAKTAEKVAETVAPEVAKRVEQAAEKAAPEVVEKSVRGAFGGKPKIPKPPKTGIPDPTDPLVPMKTRPRMRPAATGAHVKRGTKINATGLALAKADATSREIEALLAEGKIKDALPTGPTHVSPKVPLKVPNSIRVPKTNPVKPLVKKIIAARKKKLSARVRPTEFGLLDWLRGKPKKFKVDPRIVANAKKAAASLKTSVVGTRALLPRRVALNALARKILNFDGVASPTLLRARRIKEFAVRGSLVRA